MLIQILVLVAGSLSSSGGAKVLGAAELPCSIVQAQKAPAKLIIKKYIFLHVSAKWAFDRLDRKELRGVDFMSTDPTDNSIVARGTKCGLERLWKMTAELDKKLP